MSVVWWTTIIIFCKIENAKNRPPSSLGPGYPIDYVYKYYHKRLLFRGGSGDKKFWDHQAWLMGFQWNQTSAFSTAFWPGRAGERGLHASHAYSVMAVEKMRFGGGECTDPGEIYAVLLRDSWRSKDPAMGPLGSHASRWRLCSTIERWKWNDEDQGLNGEWEAYNFRTTVVLHSELDGLFWVDLAWFYGNTQHLQELMLPPKHEIKLDIEPVPAADMERICGGPDKHVMLYSVGGTRNS